MYEQKYASFNYLFNIQKGWDNSAGDPLNFFLPKVFILDWVISITPVSLPFHF